MTHTRLCTVGPHFFISISFSTTNFGTIAWRRHSCDLRIEPCPMQAKEQCSAPKPRRLGSSELIGHVRKGRSEFASSFPDNYELPLLPECQESPVTFVNFCQFRVTWHRPAGDDARRASGEVLGSGSSLHSSRSHFIWCHMQLTNDTATRLGLKLSRNTRMSLFWS